MMKAISLHEIVAMLGDGWVWSTIGFWLVAPDRSHVLKLAAIPGSRLYSVTRVETVTD